MGFYGCIPRFIKNHASWILTALGLGGMTATVILTAKAAPEAKDAMDVEISKRFLENKEKIDSKRGIYADNEQYVYYPLPELTFSEKFEIAAPTYLPAFLVGLASAGCFIGAQIINGKQQAALIAAYGLLAQEFNGYRSEVKDEIGAEREKQIFQANRQKMLAMQEEIKRLRDSCDTQTYMITTLPNVTFDLKPGQFDKACLHFNRNMQLRGGGPIAELYEFLGIPREAWDEAYKDEAEDYGWEEYENEVTWGCSWTDFVVRQIHLKNEKTINLICPTIPPYKLDLDYGTKDCSADNLYRNCPVDYDDIERWLNSVEGRATVLANQPDISF